MTDHEKLLQRGFKKVGEGGLRWTHYYERDDGAKAIIEYGPQPHQVKSVHVYNVPIKVVKREGA